MSDVGNQRIEENLDAMQEELDKAKESFKKKDDTDLWLRILNMRSMVDYLWLIERPKVEQF